MTLACVYVRHAAKRLDVAIVVLEDSHAVAHVHLPAPAGEPESRQLSALYVRALEMFRAHDVEMVVVWAKDAAPGGRIKLNETLELGRGEGAILAAAGELGIASDLISGAAVRAGLGDRAAAIAERCKSVSGLPDDDAVRSAAAGAQAWLARQEG